MDIPAGYGSLFGPRGAPLAADPRLALPDAGEAMERLGEVAAALARCGVAGLRSELAVLPAGLVYSMWRDAGAVPALVVRHDDVDSEAQVRWLPASPFVVAGARGGMSDDWIRHMGATVSWPPSLPPHQPAFDVRIVEPAGGAVASAGCSRQGSALVTLDAGEVAAEVLRWHRRAVEVLPDEAPPRTAAPAAVTVGFDTADPRVAALVPDVDAERLAAALPRGRRGTLESKLLVLLAPVADGGSEVGRADWVAARADGPATATVRVESVIPGNNWHRFDHAPWLWRRDCAAPPAAWSPRADLLRLLDSGDVVGALEQAGVDLDMGARRLLSGRRLGWSSPAQQDAWPAFARDQLRRCAPWLLAGPAADYVRANCGKKSDGARLLIFPHQPWQSKAGLSVMPGARPLLAVRSTSSNRVLPRVLWERPG